jgi:arginine exporter protein ArgO
MEYECLFEGYVDWLIKHSRGIIAVVYRVGCVFVWLSGLVMLRTKTKRGRATLLTYAASAAGKGKRRREKQRGLMCTCLDPHHILQGC